MKRQIISLHVPYSASVLFAQGDYQPGLTLTAVSPAGRRYIYTVDAWTPIQECRDVYAPGVRINFQGAELMEGEAWENEKCPMLEFTQAGRLFVVYSNSKLERPECFTAADNEADEGADWQRGGWVKLWRGLKRTSWWSNTTARLIMVDGLMDANRAEVVREYKGYKIVIPRGAFATSYWALSEECGVARKSVKGALEALKAAGEISVTKVGNNGAAGLVIQLLRYDILCSAHKGATEKRAERKGKARKTRKGV